MTVPSYRHPSSLISGKVSIGGGSSIWAGAVIRGDLAPISVGAYSNIQDNSVVHCDMGHPSEIGSFVTAGHGAVMHGCTIGDCCIVGMNSVVLNGSSIGMGSIVAAGSVVKQNTIAPPLSLIAGNPAVIMKNRYSDLCTQLESALVYVCLSMFYRDSIDLNDVVIKRIYSYSRAESLRLNGMLSAPGAPDCSSIMISDFPLYEV